MTARRFELKDGKSSKFWQIDASKSKTIVRFGRIGSDGQVAEKEHASPAAAKAAADKLIKQKVAKGYREVSTAKKRAANSIASSRPTTKAAAKTADPVKTALRKAPKDVKTATFIDSVAALVPGDMLEISGLIGPGSRGAGVKSGRERNWTFQATFDAWKAGKGPLVREPLQVRMKGASDKKLSALMKRFAEFSQLTIRAKATVFGPQKQKVADLIRVVAPSRDAELGRVARELQKPIQVKDPFFGSLTYDRGAGWYEGKKEWGGRKVVVNFCTELEDNALDQLLSAAKTMWKSQPNWTRKIEQYALKNILPNKNANWLMDDETPIVPKEFLRRMKLDSIAFYFPVHEDGISFEFWHDDDEMFGYHSIVIKGTLSKGPTAHDLCG